MSKTMKLIALSLCLILCVSVLAGCKKDQPDVVDNGEGTITIKLGDWPLQEGQPERYAVYEKNKAAFEEKYPNIKIETDDWWYSVDTFLPLAASGQLPNMYRVPYTEPRKIIGSGYALDITDVFVGNGFDKTMNKNALSLVEKDNGYFGIPYSGYMLCMQYNVALFEEAGLVDENGVPTYPTTWEEVGEISKIIKDKTGKYGFSIATTDTWGGWHFLQIAWGFGVNFMEEVDGKFIATFDSQETINALQWYSDMKWKYDVLPVNVLLTGEDLDQLFGTQQLAMRYGGSGENIDRKMLDYGIQIEDIGMGPIPGGEGGRFAQFGGSVYLFSKETSPEQVDACIKWINFVGEGPEAEEGYREMVEEKFQLYEAEKNGIVPTDRGGFFVYEQSEQVKITNEISAKYANINPNYFMNIQEGVTLRPEEPMYAQQLYSTFSNLLQDVLLNENADIPALLKQAQINFQKDYLDQI